MPKTSAKSTTLLWVTPDVLFIYTDWHHRFHGSQCNWRQNSHPRDWYWTLIGLSAFLTSEYQLHEFCFATRSKSKENILLLHPDRISVQSTAKSNEGCWKFLSGSSQPAVEVATFKNPVREIVYSRQQDQKQTNKENGMLIRSFNSYRTSPEIYQTYFYRTYF